MFPVQVESKTHRNAYAGFPPIYQDHDLTWGMLMI